MPSSNDFSAAMAQTSLPWRWMRLGWRWPVSPAEGQKSRPRLPRCLPSTVGPKRKPAIDIVDLSSGASRQGRPPPKDNTAHCNVTLRSGRRCRSDEGVK